MARVDEEDLLATVAETAFGVGAEVVRSGPEGGFELGEVGHHVTASQGLHGITSWQSRLPDDPATSAKMRSSRLAMGIYKCR